MAIGTVTTVTENGDTILNVTPNDSTRLTLNTKDTYMDKNVVINILGEKEESLPLHIGTMDYDGTEEKTIPEGGVGYIGPVMKQLNYMVMTPQPTPLADNPSVMWLAGMINNPEIFTLELLTPTTTQLTVYTDEVPALYKVAYNDGNYSIWPAHYDTYDESQMQANEWYIFTDTDPNGVKVMLAKSYISSSAMRVPTLAINGEEGVHKITKRFLPYPDYPTFVITNSDELRQWLFNDTSDNQNYSHVAIRSGVTYNLQAGESIVPITSRTRRIDGNNASLTLNLNTRAVSCDCLFKDVVCYDLDLEIKNGTLIGAASVFENCDIYNSKIDVTNLSTSYSSFTVFKNCNMDNNDCKIGLVGENLTTVIVAEGDDTVKINNNKFYFSVGFSGTITSFTGIKGKEVYSNKVLIAGSTASASTTDGDDNPDYSRFADSAEVYGIRATKAAHNEIQAYDATLGNSFYGMYTDGANSNFSHNTVTVKRFFMPCTAVAKMIGMWSAHEGSTFVNNTINITGNITQTGSYNYVSALVLAGAKNLAEANDCFVNTASQTYCAHVSATGCKLTNNYIRVENQSNVSASVKQSGVYAPGAVSLLANNSVDMLTKNASQTLRGIDTNTNDTSVGTRDAAVFNNVITLSPSSVVSTQCRALNGISLAMNNSFYGAWKEYFLAVPFHSNNYNANTDTILDPISGDDTKVTQTASTTAGALPILIAKGTTTATDGAYFDTDVTINPGTGNLDATNYTVSGSTIVATKTTSGGWLWS